MMENQESTLRPEAALFDRSPDPALDELTELAAVLCSADFAYIGWMDYSRLWFKSRFGFYAIEQPRASTACQWMLDAGAPMLIPIAGQDGRFPPEGIPLPGAAICQSYAAVPLRNSALEIVGTLAVLARDPYRFKPEHLTLMEVLGRQAMTRLELFGRIRAQEQAQRAQQRSERALAVERLFVASTLDSIPALVMVLDTAGRVVRMNYSCAQLTGLNEASSVGRLLVDQVLEPGDREWVSAKLREAGLGQDSGPHETEWRTASGELRRVSWTLRPLAGPDNEIQYVILSGQDVTDKRLMEAALLTSAARYREVVESSLGFVFTCALDGRLTSLNAFTAETLGYPADALVGRPITDLMDSSGAAEFQECLRTLGTGSEWQGAIPLRRSDGVFRRIAFRSRLTEIAGEPPFLLNHGMDVTEQHEAEQALLRATRQRELILESVGDGIYGIDLAGRLTFINAAGARMLGYTPEQLAGCDVHRVLNHGNAEGVLYSDVTNPILQALGRSEAIRMRGEVFLRRDGTPMPVEYAANPIVEEGRVSGMVVAFQDVSERLRLERMKDEFISTVSHELRTPLTSMRASLGLIQSGSLDKRPEKQHQLIEVAMENCDRLGRLVNDILDFDNVKQGRLPLHRKSVEPIDLLRRASDIAHPAATQAHIGFKIDAAKAPRVNADEDRVLQVLSELVTNAIKFSLPETTIRLKATPIDGGADVRFTVEDQGRGIAPEKLERIFERFQQGDASDSRALGGTGLGLALCRSIIEQHGGRMWAESELGKGSRLMFTLPVAETKLG
jgi:PAS domain S-box-containing protein